jgi:hypothetical protein
LAHLTDNIELLTIFHRSHLSRRDGKVRLVDRSNR